MLGFGRLALLRQSREEMEHGRLEEAHRLLSDPAMQGQKGVGALLARLGRAFAERGERKLRRDDFEGAWADLLQAEKIGGVDRAAEQLRQALARVGLAEVRALLQVGEPARAEEAAARLRARGVQAGELGVFQEVVRGWRGAQEMAAQGELARALESVERIRRLVTLPLEGLDRFQRDLEQRQKDLAGLLVNLHEASDAARWRDVIEISEQVLLLAPSHPDARKARARAWKAVEPVTVPIREGSLVSPGPPPAHAPRLFLWIDGVGGYLVCLGTRLSLGQAGVDTVADIPLVADVSRLHALLGRDQEGYMLEAMRPAKINGQPATRALLQSGDRITLGESCQVVFQRPVPVSASARLDVVSGHRLPLALDGILLMADTLVLGPGPQAHVTIPDLKTPVILYRQRADAEGAGEALGIRHAGAMTVNGKKTTERAALAERTTVVTEELTLAVEPASFGRRT